MEPSDTDLGLKIFKVPPSSQAMQGVPRGCSIPETLNFREVGMAEVYKDFPENIQTPMLFIIARMSFTIAIAQPQGAPFGKYSASL